MKTKILLLALISLFALSCVTQRKCASKFPSVASRDSIRIETVKEVPYPIPGDSILVEAPVIDCPDQSLIKFENSKLKQEISIIKGKLIASTLIKPDTVFVPVVETNTVVKEVKVPEVVRHVPGIYKVSLSLWIGVILAVVSYVLIRLFVLKK